MLDSERYTFRPFWLKNRYVNTHRKLQKAVAQRRLMEAANPRLRCPTCEHAPMRVRSARRRWLLLDCPACGYEERIRVQ